MTPQDLQAIQAIMKAELAPINERLDTMSKRLDTVDKRLDTVDMRLDAMDKRLDTVCERLDLLEESQEEVRTCVNALLEWSDKVSESFQFPLPRL